MAFLFSKVTLEGGGYDTYYLTGGIPRDYDDLSCDLDLEDFLELIVRDEEISVHVEAYLYGEGESCIASGDDIMFFMDEFGTLPPISSAEMMYSASRSRRLSLVSIIQSYQQLEKNYGKEGATIIQDNCQITIAGGFAPTSETAEIISRALGSRTVMTGAVSRSKNDPSQSLQMTERPLMTADELKSMNKGSFIVMKTGTHPFISKLKLFFKWGIDFDCEPYTVVDKGARKVEYTNRDIIEDEILKKFPHYVVSQKAEHKATSKSGDSNDMAQSHTPIRTEGHIQELVEAEEHSPKELQQSIPVRTN